MSEPTTASVLLLVGGWILTLFIGYGILHEWKGKDYADDNVTFLMLGPALILGLVAGALFGVLVRCSVFLGGLPVKLIRWLRRPRPLKIAIPEARVHQGDV